MRKYWFASFLVIFALVISACNAAPATESSQLALPTPQVPPIAEIDAAYQRWRTSDNQSYLAEVEERRQDSHRKYLVVVKDGQVRAAQVLERNPEGKWGEPIALSLEQAQSFTPEKIFEQLRRDALGQGDVPVNLKVRFDPSLGYPLAIHLETLPFYNEAGQLILDRKKNSDLTVSITALLEDTFRTGKEAILNYQQSGGQEALCGLLRIFTDNTSVFTDDCRDDVLRSEVPSSLQPRLEELRASFSSLDDLREGSGLVERLTITGKGEGSADPGEREAAWQLVEEMQRVLSEPIGLGLIVSFIQDGRLYGLDVYNKDIIPADLAPGKPVAGGAWTPDAMVLAFSRDGGLTYYNNQTGEFSELLPAPAEGFYLPRGWTYNGTLLVDQIFSDAKSIRHGWISLDDRSWHDLPIPAESPGYGCDTGMSWSPGGQQVAITGLEYGNLCNTSPGLVVADLDSGSAVRILSPTVLSGDEAGTEQIAGARTPAWSPDGEWIAFSLDQDATAPLDFPARLYRVHPDGSALTPLTNNSSGQASHPVWSQDGSLYYGLSGESTETDGIYQYNPSENSHALLMSGSGLHPVGISPDGEFLLVEGNEGLKLWQFRLNTVVAEIPAQGEVPPGFIGWVQIPQ